MIPKGCCTVATRHAGQAGRCFEAAKEYALAVREYRSAGDLRSAAQACIRVGKYEEAAKTLEECGQWMSATCRRLISAQGATQSDYFSSA